MVRYSDALVEITNGDILFRDYYFPFGARRVRWADIAGITAQTPTVWNGRYKLWGGDGLTWLPRDWKRPWRATMFCLTFPQSFWKVNFTVEDARRVETVLRSLGVLREG